MIDKCTGRRQLRGPPSGMVQARLDATTRARGHQQAHKFVAGSIGQNETGGEESELWEIDDQQLEHTKSMGDVSSSIGAADVNRIIWRRHVEWDQRRQNMKVAEVASRSKDHDHGRMQREKSAKEIETGTEVFNAARSLVQEAREEHVRRVAFRDELKVRHIAEKSDHQ